MNILIFVPADSQKAAKTAADLAFAHASVRVAATAISAKAQVLLTPPDVAVVDLDAENGRGKALAELIREKAPRANLILVSGSAAVSRDALKLYPSGYLLAPFTTEQLLTEFGNLRSPVYESTVIH